MDIDPRHVDEVLATTRAVRRRLDLERPVDNQLLLDCIDLALMHQCAASVYEWRPYPALTDAA